jgi:hypothetical protein
MKPVRIRYYGLIPLTRRTYLVLQVPVLVLLVVLLAVLFLLPAPPHFGIPEQVLHPVARWLLDHLLWIVLLIFILELLDTLFTLRAFARKEAEEQTDGPRERSLATDQPTPPAR